MNRNSAISRQRGRRRAPLSNRNLRLISQRNSARIRNGSWRPNIPRSRPRSRLVSQNRTLGGQPSLQKYLAPLQVTKSNKSNVKHREPLGVVNGSTGFAITTFQINPGLATTFPWLSAQALGYESYKINKLSVEYCHTTNEFTGIGTIVLAPDYDSSDSPPTSVVQAEQMVDSIQGAVAKDWTCTLRPRGIGILGPKRYTRSGALAANDDIKTYDIAQFHVITSGQTDASQIGRLWINYDITLYEPQPSQVSDIFLAGFFVNADGSGAATTNLVGTDAVSSGAIVMSGTGNIITVSNLIPGFQYRLIYRLAAAVLTTAPTIVFDGSNLVGVITTIATLNGGTTVAFIAASFRASASVGTFTLGGLTVVTTPSYAAVEISGSITQSSL